MEKEQRVRKLSSIAAENMKNKLQILRSCGSTSWNRLLLGWHDLKEKSLVRDILVIDQE